MQKEHLMQFSINSSKNLALDKMSLSIFLVNKMPNGKQLEEFPLKLGTS